MSIFQYTITNYDNAAKTLDVTFGDGGYAKVFLMDPLPENIDELELIIRQYVLPQQYIDALESPVDMSYVDQYVGETRECERRSIQSFTATKEDEPVDPTDANEFWNVDNPYAETPDQVLASMELEAEVLNSQNEFEASVLEVLKKNGLLP